MGTEIWIGAGLLGLWVFSILFSLVRSFSELFRSLAEEDVVASIESYLQHNEGKLTAEDERVWRSLAGGLRLSLQSAREGYRRYRWAKRFGIIVVLYWAGLFILETIK